MNTSPTLLALALSSAFSAVQAQPIPSPDGASALDTVHVHGKIEREPRASANKTTQVIDAAQIEREMAQNLEDLMRYVPGVSIVDLGRFGDNGFNIRGLEGDRVALLVDGLSFAESLETTPQYEFFRSGRGGLDVDTLKQVEIIKGADGISAGSGALSGAVRFTTKDPSDFLRAADGNTHLGLRTAYTSASDETLGSLSFAHRWGAIESMLIYTHREGHEAESWYDSTPEHTGTARRTPDPIDRESRNLLGKIELIASDAHRFGLVFERNRSENLVENLSRVFAPSYLERWGEDASRHDRIGLRYRSQAERGFYDDLDLQIDRFETRSLALTRILAGSGCPGSGAPCLRTEDRSTDQVLDRAALDLVKQWQTPSAGHTLVYGAAWQQRDVDFQAVDTRWNAAGDITTIEVDPKQVPKTDASSWNLYLRDSVRFAQDRLGANAGLRYDRHDYSPQVSPLFVDGTGTVRDLSFSSASWQLGTDYRIGVAHQVFAQLGRGFRAPTVGELFAPTSTSTATDLATGETVTVWNSAANPDLKSERSLNAELGYRWQTARSLIGVSVFRDRYSDFIESVNQVRNPDTDYQTCVRGACTTVRGNTYSTRANLGEVRTRGIEFEGRWQLAEQWLLRAAGAYTEGEKSNGDPLPSISPARAVLGLSHASTEGRWNVHGTLTHSLSKKLGDARLSQGGGFTQPQTPDYLSDAYTVFDLFGTYHFGNKLQLSAGIYNLLDERYYLWPRIRLVQNGSSPLFGYVSDDGIGRFSEPGRNYRVNLSYRF